MGEFTYEYDGYSFDKCIKCKKELDIPSDYPIKLRENYVEKEGQYCSECYGRRTMIITTYFTEEGKELKLGKQEKGEYFLEVADEKILEFSTEHEADGVAEYIIYTVDNNDLSLKEVISLIDKETIDLLGRLKKHTEG